LIRVLDSRDRGNGGKLSSAAYQQGTHRQQRGAHALIQPGPEPQPPVMPLHAACFTIGVAFLRAWMLAAPRCSVCALADMAIVPSASAAAANVIESLLIRPPLENKTQDSLKRQKDDTRFHNRRWVFPPNFIAMGFSTKFYRSDTSMTGCDPAR
jgi:hypothetical protein